MDGPSTITPDQGPSGSLLAAVTSGSSGIPLDAVQSGSPGSFLAAAKANTPVNPVDVDDLTDAFDDELSIGLKSKPAIWEYPGEIVKRMIADADSRKLYVSVEEYVKAGKGLPEGRLTLPMTSASAKVATGKAEDVTLQELAEDRMMMMLATYVLQTTARGRTFWPW